jgi:hypothetical protein
MIHSSSQPESATLRRRVFLLSALTVSTAQLGCRTTDSSLQTLPRVVSRFSAAESVSPVSMGLVGLSIQSLPNTVTTAFAGRLGAVVAAEIELTASGVRVEPWDLSRIAMGHDASLENAAAGLRRTAEQSQLVTVSFTSTTRNPNADTPNGIPAERNAGHGPDQILSLQVMDYRPWFPMSTTVRLTILDAPGFQPVNETTAIWTAAEDGVTGGCDPNRKKKLLWNCREPHSHPSANYNSPEAFIQVIAPEIALWFAEKSPNQLLPVMDAEAETAARTTGSRWSVLSKLRRRQ